MPYDPIRDAPGFRVTLRRLSDIERLTSQAIVDLFNKHRTRGDNLAISRATLDRFVQGGPITKIRELRAIHDLLSRHPAYGTYFARNAPTHEQAVHADGEMLSGQAWGTFFSGDGISRDDPRLVDMRTALPGRFVLMRRDHDRVSLENGARVSSLSLEAVDGGVAVQESQSYRTLDGEMPFEQTDHGYLFTHGPLIYFLMKEIGGTAVKATPKDRRFDRAPASPRHGSARPDHRSRYSAASDGPVEPNHDVERKAARLGSLWASPKFGVIELTLPELDRRQPVQYIQGYVMVASRRGVFPRTRFAARRHNAAQHAITSGIVRLDDIDDPRAIEHLRLDYTTDGAAQTA